ncbi:glycosyltransferase family 2 protein [Paenarthrobacter sp. PAE-2]|uniref:glycosyltransferase family 2 protein n=1 Tax=Paenarthrobacter sp. PAE-2 TaxID=2982532 RepID=UPI0039B6EB96
MVDVDARDGSALVVSVVIPSLRPGISVLRLIRSLEDQRFNYLQIALVDQSTEVVSRGVLEAYDGPLKSKITVVRSEPGLARARNAGLEALDPGWDVVLLPDDDVWLDGDVSDSIMQAVRNGVSAGSGRLKPEFDVDGVRINFPSHEISLTPRNVWRASIEACYFLTPRFLDVVGNYDESLGLGAGTPWQSGEGTDLLLRGLRHGLPVRFVPGYELVETKMPTLTIQDHRSRLRFYARGTGRVFARNYTLAAQVALLMRSLARLVIQLFRRPGKLQDNWQILIGRLEGVTGKLL